MPEDSPQNTHHKKIIIESLIEKNDLWALDCFLLKHVNLVMISSQQLGRQGKRENTRGSQMLCPKDCGRLWPSCCAMGQIHAKLVHNIVIYNAFDYLLNFRPYREHGIYFFGATLLNTTTNNNTDAYSIGG